jgi:hypothetical protein
VSPLDSSSGGYGGRIGAEELQYLTKAARMIANIARSTGAKVAKEIPGATEVVASAEGVYVVTWGDRAPMAAPFEGGLNHPLFGDREHWYTMKRKPYMQQAAYIGAKKAAEIFSHAIDAKLRDAGFK